MGNGSSRLSLIAGIKAEAAKSQCLGELLEFAPAMPEAIPIDDAADPRIAPYANIRERDLVGRERLFVAEGEVVLRVLLTRSRHEAHSIFLAEKRVAALTPLLASVPTSVPIYVAPQAILDGIAGFPMHRGVLALGRRAPARSAEELLAAATPRAIVVCLFGIANHDNVGGIFRNAAAFGADSVILDGATCDPLYRKAIRVSVGGTLIVPFARLGPADDVLDLLAKHDFVALALSPRGTGRLDDVQRGQRIAILLGAEGTGLPADVLARAVTIGIPMAADFDSLNVATTSGIVLHHIRNQ
jgi:tRNA G18 (ribose-2'-O)-methylase SpoU